VQWATRVNTCRKVQSVFTQLVEPSWKKLQRPSCVKDLQHLDLTWILCNWLCRSQTSGLRNKADEDINDSSRNKFTGKSRRIQSELVLRQSSRAHVLQPSNKLRGSENKKLALKYYVWSDEQKA
jgi:hypothetical protein